MLTNNKIHQIVKEVLMESLSTNMNENQDNTEYTHLAVNKFTNLIVNGWDYSNEDPQDLKQFKNDYFIIDLKDYGFNPKVYKIITSKFAAKNGINQWSNTGVFPLKEEYKMKQEGEDFYAIAYEQHPDWFIDDVNESKKRKTLIKEEYCWWGDTKPLETIMSACATYLEGVNEDDFEDEDDRARYDLYKWAERVYNEAEKYIRYNAHNVSINGGENW